MEVIKPGYYAVIPANVRYSKEVSNGAKLLYAEITCLSNAHGYCWASNKYFADLYDVKPNAISRWISELARAGFILTIVDNAEGNSRKIWLSETQFLTKKGDRVSPKKVIPYHQKSQDPLTKKGDIILKENNKRKSESEERFAPPAPAENNPSTLEEKEVKRGLVAPAAAPTPARCDVPLRYDQCPLPTSSSELKEALRNYFVANPREWQDGVLYQSKATMWPADKIQDTITRFCAHQEGEGNLKRTFGQYKGMLIKWFLDQPRFERNDAAARPSASASNSPVPKDVRRL